MGLEWRGISLASRGVGGTVCLPVCTLSICLSLPFASSWSFLLFVLIIVQIPLALIISVSFSLYYSLLKDNGLFQRPPPLSNVRVLHPAPAIAPLFSVYLGTCVSRVSDFGCPFVVAVVDFISVVHPFLLQTLACQSGVTQILRSGEEG